jgi:hypothetical protein
MAFRRLDENQLNEFENLVKKGIEKSIFTENIKIRVSEDDYEVAVDNKAKILTFSKDIKEYEKQINENSGRDDILLHSFIISQTDFKEVRKNNAYNSEVEYNELGLFFPKDDLSYIDSIFREILNEDEEVSYVE